MHTWLWVLTKVLTVLSLKLILSVYPVKKRGTYEGGEGQPADFTSMKQGIPLSRLIVGRPENGLVTIWVNVQKKKNRDDPPVAELT